MPLVNALPANIFPGNPWSSAAPQQAQELITTWNLDELTALSSDPGPDIGWGNIGTHTSVGMGIVKVGHSMPQTLDFQTFKPGGARTYHTLDVIASTVRVNPWDLSFGIPMVWDAMGNGYKLMSPSTDGTLMDFVGVNGLGAQYVIAGRAYKCQLLASLFYSGLYSTALGLTTPKALAYGGAAMPAPNAQGIALFTDGTGGEGTTGAMHYANPTNASSGRFKNVWPAFGTFAANYGASLVKMAIKPHSTLSNVTSGARVTDTFGPPGMYEKFWAMMVQSLTLQTAEVGGNGVGAATTNPYAQAIAAGMSQENFIGTTFGPRRFWIVPQLDNHPYVQANPGKDFWINVSNGPDRSTGLPQPSWAQAAGNNKEFVPVFRFYGPGDPRAMGERLMRFEGDLDGGAAGGAPGVIDMFFET